MFDKDGFCKQIDDAIVELVQLRKAIADDNTKEVLNLQNRVRTIAANLSNRIEDYLNNQDIRSVESLNKNYRSKPS